MEGYMFFMNTKTATETLNEGVCFGIGEARYSDEQNCEPKLEYDLKRPESEE